MNEQKTAVEFEEVRIAVPWGHIAGRWYGNRAVRPILALHGWLDNVGTWERLVPLLPEHIGVLAVDLPGHGQSSRYPTGMMYHLIDYVHVIVRIAAEYNWPKVSLLAHSMGVVAGFIYTSLYPHKVDMFLCCDMVSPPYRPHDFMIKFAAHKVEKSLIEDERIENLALLEPPAYTFAELEEVLHKGTFGSVDVENCKYLLDRSITKSTKYPDKYYFARDGKVKFYTEFVAGPGLVEEMAARIRNVPYCIIAVANSRYFTTQMQPVIDILRRNNPHFELHTIEGTHHVHLNNPEAVAALMNPFISRHRPATLDSWSLGNGSTTLPSTHRKKTPKRVWWGLRSKL